MTSKNYVTPELEVLEIDVEIPILQNSPTGESFGGQNGYDGDWI